MTDSLSREREKSFYANRKAGHNVRAYLNTMICSLCSAPRAVGGVLVFPSRIDQEKNMGG